MDNAFRGVRWVAPTELGISQLYLSEAKLEEVNRWFDPNRMDLCQPLPVHDFGDGRLTLTDGHSRAFTAYRYSVQVPIVYDTDDMVTGEQGQLLYKNDLVWCRRFHLRTVADLAGRIVAPADYQALWLDRCQRAHDLLTRVGACEREAMQRRRPDLFLYGVSSDLTVCFFEDLAGKTVEVPR